jgi:hypothetical protein
MVNVNRQPSAFESWSGRVPQRFTAGQHIRVAAVILFMHSTVPATDGLAWLPFVRLIPNPHACTPLPAWIADTVDALRAETRRGTASMVKEAGPITSFLSRSGRVGEKSRSVNTAAERSKERPGRLPVLRGHMAAPAISRCAWL